MPRCATPTSASPRGATGCAPVTCSSSPPTTASTWTPRTPITRASTRSCWRRGPGSSRAGTTDRSPTWAPRPCGGSPARRPPNCRAARSYAESVPELPEVETIRRQLAPNVEGRTLERLQIDDARWCAPIAPAEVAAAVEGRTIEQLDRRGKYLDFAVSDEAHLLVHLRMTGTLLYDPDPGTPYARVRFDLGDGHHLL